MLSVQTVSGRVVRERRNGSTQSRYQGYTTGAQTSEAAMGQAHASDSHWGGLLRNARAVNKPARIATATTICGLATRSSAAKTGPLKRNRCTNMKSDPTGIRPLLRKGR